MATKNNQKIRDMVELLALTGKEMLPLAREGKNYKVTTKILSEYIGSTGGGSLPTDAAAQIKQNTDNIEILQSNINSLSTNKADITYVDAEIDKILGGASGAYDTLKEIEDILADEETGIDALLTEIGTKENKGSGVSEIAFDSDIYELELTRTKDASGSQTAITVDLSSIKNDIPTKVSQLTNDSGFLTSHQSLDEYINSVNEEGSGNVVTGYRKSGKSLVLQKGMSAYSKTEVDKLIGDISIPSLDGYVTTETFTISLDNLANTYLSFRGGGTVSGATTFSGGLSVQNSLTLLGVNVAAGSSGLTFDGKIPMYSGDAYTKSEANEEFHPLTTVDTAPTLNSNNLVTSGGVAKAVADLAESADTLYQRKGSYLTSSSTLASANLDNNTISIAGTSVSLGGSITQNQLIVNLGLKGLAFKDSIDYNDLNNKPTIPSAVTESTVSGWGFTKNAGTITGIKMNGASKGTSGVVDLGTVLTSHQTIHSLTIKNSDENYSLTYTPNSSSLSITLGKSWVGLGNVENTKLSTWAGSANITTLGTITSGTWNGSKIANAYLANSSIMIAGTSIALGGSMTQNQLMSLAGVAAVDARFSDYLPLSGGEMASGSRISSGKNMYIGRADNVGWVGLQDICSQTSLNDSVWSIRTNGVARFQNIYEDGLLLSSKYLLQSGGTMTGDLTIDKGEDVYGFYSIGSNTGKRVIVHNAAGLAGINGRIAELSLYDGDSKLGGIGVYSEGIIYTYNTSNYHTIIHSGNINNYAVTSGTLDDFPRLNGTSPSGASATGTWGIDISGSAAKAEETLRFSCIMDSNSTNRDLNTGLFGGGLMRNYTGYTSAIFTNYPEEMRYGCVLELSPFGKSVTTNDLSGQLAWDINHHGTDSTRNLWWRANDDRNFSYAKWHQIAFTDSTVAAANKLVNANGDEVAVTTSGGNLNIFGNSTLFRGAIHADRYLGSNKTAGAAVVVNKGGDYFGFGASLSDLETFSMGLVSDTNGTWKSEFVYFDSIGRVGIGESVPTYKLDVKGVIRTSNRLLVGENADTGIWRGSIYSGSLAANDIAIHGDKIILNGGNVGIGTAAPEYKLDVKGGARVSGDLFVNGAQFSVGSDGKLSISKTINGYLPLSGGKIGEGNSNQFPLYVASTSSYTGMGFITSAGTAWLRYLGNADWNVTDLGWSHSYNLIHSGNIGSQSVSYATNAESATKLATSHTIWGQSFDGTGDVAGAPSFPSFVDINRNADTGVLLNSSKLGFEIETYANDVRLKTYTESGGSNTSHLVLTGSGNVGIGTTNPNTKLHVVGDAKIDGALSTSGGDLTIETTNSDIAITHYKGTTKLWTMGNYNGCANFSEALYVQSGSTPVKVATVSDLSSYLPKTGDTMTGPIKYDGYASLGVHSNGNFYLGNPTRPLVIRSNGTHTINDNTLIHSGNIGSYAATSAQMTSANSLISQNRTAINGIDTRLSTVEGSYLSTSGGTIDGKLVAIAGGSGASSISYANAALTIGTVNRTETIGSYFPGLAFNHMYTYYNASTYRDHAHGWIGLRLHSTPVAELSYLIFATNGSTVTGSNLTERMCIAPSGEVGIGTTAPEYTLEVNGDAKVSNLIVGGYTLGGNSSGFTINISGTTYNLLSTSNGYTKTNADNTFIKKTGGTGLGTLEFGTTPNAHIAGCSSTSQLIFRTSINATSSLLFEQEGSNGYVIRSDDEAAYWSLGDSLNRFNTVYCRSVSESSDATKKNVIGNIELTSSQIANAPAVHFTWKDDGTKSVGTIAQYWNDILPEVVTGEEGSMGMNYAVLGVVSAIILARNIETHEQKIQRLEKEISDLRKELETVAKKSVNQLNK